MPNAPLRFLHARRLAPQTALLTLSGLGGLFVCLALALAEEPSDAERSTAATARQATALLETHCLDCHGGRFTRGGLDLTTREGLVKGGQHGPAVVSGDAASSRLLQQVQHQLEPGMPFKREPLAAGDIATLAAWIDGGAHYPAPLKCRAGGDDWWSLKPLVKPAPPKLPRSPDSDWVRTPIDQFVLARLNAKGLRPAPPADRRTLLRRVTFDLVGLPPTAEDTAAFLADDAPDAYERLVDRLLDSPQFGERWARHWMDTVHYAETHGHDQDRPRPNSWPYRDYLIHAFNTDKPYARFVAEQLAGDVLYPDDSQAIVALGFLATGPWDESSLRDIREDTVDREIARYLDRDDMVTTAMSTFVSTTVHCARCHEHKFDPITQAEYYGLQAVFAGVDKAERTYDPDPAVARTRQSLQARQAAVPDLIAKADPSLLTPEIANQTAAWEQTVTATASRWRIIDPVSITSASGSTLTRQADASVLASGTRPETDTYTLRFAITSTRLTGLRLEVLTDDSLPMKGPGRQDNGNLHLNELQVFIAPHDATEPTAGRPVKLIHPQADFNQAGWTIEMALDGNPATAWGIFPEIGKSHRAVCEFTEPITLAETDLLTVRLEQSHGRGHLIGRVRIAVTSAPAPLPAEADVLPAAIVAILQTPLEQRTNAQRATLAGHVLNEQLSRDLAALPAPQKVYVATNRFQAEGSFRPAETPRAVHVLRRGDINKPGDPAQPGALACVGTLPSEWKIDDPNREGDRRAALAHWVADSHNPLTWRSIVNRIWHYHFGRGLVDTPNDFGRMGALPSHPELLDWLAVTLQEQGGSLKSLHQLMVTSATYRQASQHDPHSAEVDGDNRLLWRMNRQRLDAEEIRDAVLSISQKLDPLMGGPSVKQFVQSPGIHVTPVVDYLAFDIDSREHYRRSVYRFIFRTLPDPFMETLDCADASQLTPVRGASVTALQALAMLNNRFIVRQSEHIAARAEQAASARATQVSLLYEWILGRPATPREIGLVTDYAQKHGLPNAVRVLLNSNEFMFVN
ncbi:MAG: PSD1 domain-containing protein [Planctomycetes bacterium]|nr:PSD1 domain-containing protein [Planctomycetota bacterium]